MGHHSRNGSHNGKRSERSHKPDKSHQEEMAAELAVPGVMGNASDGERREYARKETRSAGVAVGWAGLAIALISWFIWPVLLGISAAVLGFIAFRQGSRGLGTWSITLGLISALAYLILIPLYYALT